MPLDTNDNATSKFISAMLAAEPALAVVLDDHLAANNELLPHVFLGDVTRWLTAHGPHPRILGVLDEAITSHSRYVRDLVLVSFLENLEPGEPSDDRIVANLPIRLRVALTVVRGDTS